MTLVANQRIVIQAHVLDVEQPGRDRLLDA